MSRVQWTLYDSGPKTCKIWGIFWGLLRVMRALASRCQTESLNTKQESNSSSSCLIYSFMASVLHIQIKHRSFKNVNSYSNHTFKQIYIKPPVIPLSPKEDLVSGVWTRGNFMWSRQTNLQLICVFFPRGFIFFRL